MHVWILDYYLPENNSSIFLRSIIDFRNVCYIGITWNITNSTSHCRLNKFISCLTYYTACGVTLGHEKTIVSRIYNCKFNESDYSPGWGVYYPTTTTQKIVTIIYAIFGLPLYATLIGIVCQLTRITFFATCHTLYKMTWCICIYIEYLYTY